MMTHKTTRTIRAIEAARALIVGGCRSGGKHLGGGRLVPRIARFAVIALIAAALLRAVLFTIYGGYTLLSPVQAYHLEGVNVHFAWRFQHGLPLYPSPSGESVRPVNLVGPVYFATVGSIGRLLDAEIATLYTIGRSVTLSCSLIMAVFIAIYLSIRHGRLAALVGGATALGAAPMIGFGVMARPDMMADLLGALGFLLCCRASRASGVIGAVLLILGILTKQTAAVYLVAAAVALFVEGRKERSLAVVFAGGIGVSAVLVFLAATCEPAIFDQFLGQAKIPFAQYQCVIIADRLVGKSPELLYFPLLGCWFGLGTGSDTDRRFRILCDVLLLGSLVASAKIGSDLNYYLQLRILAAIGAGAACHHVLHHESRDWKKVASLLVGAVLCGPSIASTAQSAYEARQLWEHPTRPLKADSPARYRAYDRLCLEWAADPNVRILTDYDQIAAYEQERADFLDVYLLRLRATNNNASVSPLVRRVESHDFDLVILASNINAPSYDRSFWRLPRQLAAAIREGYRLSETRNGLFIYVPDGNASQP